MCGRDQQWVDGLTATHATSVSKPGHRLPNARRSYTDSNAFQLHIAVSVHPIEDDSDPTMEFLLPLLHLEAPTQLISKLCFLKGHTREEGDYHCVICIDFFFFFCLMR